MSSVNKVILVGNLGKDPELRHTQGGTNVCNFSIATTERHKSSDGAQQERTEWHRIITFGKTAEHCKAYLSKGRSVYVEGRIQTRSWDDSSGVKRYSTEIIADRVNFLGSASTPGTSREEYEPHHDLDNVPF